MSIKNSEPNTVPPVFQLRHMRMCISMAIRFAGEALPRLPDDIWERIADICYKSMTTKEWVRVSSVCRHWANLQPSHIVLTTEPGSGYRKGYADQWLAKHCSQARSIVLLPSIPFPSRPADLMRRLVSQMTQRAHEPAYGKQYSLAALRVLCVNAYSGSNPTIRLMMDLLRSAHKLDTLIFKRWNASGELIISDLLPDVTGPILMSSYSLKHLVATWHHGGYTGGNWCIQQLEGLMNFETLGLPVEGSLHETLAVLPPSDVSRSGIWALALSDNLPKDLILPLVCIMWVRGKAGVRESIIYMADHHRDREVCIFRCRAKHAGG
jgi:hypothetical protein